MLASADLVIAAQRSSALVNYALWLRYVAGRQRFAFWGHGVNFQRTNASQLGEIVKRFISRRVHWWFAYNDTSARIVRELGFPAERITSVQNAIDTRQFQQQIRAVTAAQRQALRERIGLRGDHVCIYVGGMYEEKRLPFLIEACDHLRHEIPDFEMVFLGGGADDHVVARAAGQRAWMHHLGPTFDADKAVYVSLSKLLLMPGLVGLAVLDAFAAGVPIVTLADSEHSPEIEYLVDGVNGRMVPAGTDPAGYAKHAAALLRDEATRQTLIDGGLAASRRYTIEAMVERFAEGVHRALAAGDRPR
jgi:glycosyltransferase involved in cell wall biosynthesis